MDNLRREIERDMIDTIEGEFIMPCELTSPDGITQKYMKNNPAKLLGGQVLYFTRETNPETGEPIIVNVPVVSLRLTSLNRIPRAGEKWHVRMPVSPVEGAPYIDFVFTADKNPEAGTDMGFTRFYLQRLDSDGVDPDYEIS